MKMRGAGRGATWLAPGEGADVIAEAQDRRLPSAGQAPAGPELDPHSMAGALAMQRRIRARPVWLARRAHQPRRRHPAAMSEAGDAPWPRPRSFRQRVKDDIARALAHRCHAIGCDLEVPPAMLMCRRHWFLCPKPLRREVWRLYRSGQEVRKDPSDDYLAAARAAIEAVAEIERRQAARPQQRELLL
jgi:hypothetical protein